MVEMFNYHRGEASFNDIVDEAVELAMYRYNEKEKALPADFEERDRNLNEAVARYAVQGTRFEEKFEKEGISIYKSPIVTRNEEVRQNYNVVIAEIVNAITPTVVSNTYSRFLAEVKQVGWGDTARFIIRSNELFQINELGEGITRGVLQPIYNNEMTVDCSPITVASYVDWYQVAAGVFSISDFGYRAGRSFENYVMVKIVMAMTEATNAVGAGYAGAGVDVNNWTVLADKVRAANGGASVYAIGTLQALNKAMPAEVGLQYGLGEEMAKVGHLNRYLGIPLIPIDQAIMPQHINTKPELLIPTDVIYMVASDAYKPVKIVFEGDSVTVDKIPEETTDKTYWVSIQMRIGVAVVIGSKFGTITLE